MNNVSQTLAQTPAASYPNLSRALALYGVEAKQLAAQYPRIVTIIDSTWGSVDCLHYLDSLLFSERPGRQGFPTDVLDEIVFMKKHFLNLVILSSLLAGMIRLVKTRLKRFVGTYKK